MQVVISYYINLKVLCKNPNTEYAVSSSYHHQSNALEEVYIKFIEQRLKKCFNTNTNTNLTLLQIITLCFVIPGRGSAFWLAMPGN